MPPLQQYFSNKELAHMIIVFGHKNFQAGRNLAFCPYIATFTCYITSRIPSNLQMFVHRLLSAEHAKPFIVFLKPPHNVAM